MSEESTRRVVMQSAVLDVLTEIHTRDKKREIAELGSGGRRVVFDNDVEVGTSMVPKLAPTARVVDESIFIVYVNDHHPTEIRTAWEPLASWENVADALYEFDPVLAASVLRRRPEVRTAFRQSLLKEAAKGREVPGVETAARSLHLKVTASEAAVESARALIAGVFPAVEVGGAE